MLTLLWPSNSTRKKSAEQQLGSSCLSSMVSEAAVSLGNSPTAEGALKVTRAGHLEVGTMIKGPSPLQTPCSRQGQLKSHQGKSRRRPPSVALLLSGLDSVRKSRQAIF